MTQHKNTTLFPELLQAVSLMLSIAPLCATAVPTESPAQSGIAQAAVLSTENVTLQPGQKVVPPIAQQERLESSSPVQTQLLPTGETTIAASNSVETNITTPSEPIAQNATTSLTQPEQATQTLPIEPASVTDKAATTPEPTTSEKLLVPNGTALQSQLIPMSNSAGTPWSSYAAVAFLVLGMAATGILVIKLKHGRRLSGGKLEKQMQVISTLPLSPKRQLLLVKIKDKEIALASTESGITLLTEIESRTQNLRQLTDDTEGEDTKRKKVQQRVIREEPSKMIAASAEDSLDDSAMARSEMLMGALKNLREKSMKNRPLQTAEPIEAENTGESRSATAQVKQEAKHTFPQTTGKAQPTMRQTRAAFPKYLANAFEKEASRPSTQTASDEAGNVTNLIRERLKDLRPLS